jgi:hypothetical protein
LETAGIDDPPTFQEEMHVLKLSFVRVIFCEFFKGMNIYFLWEKYFFWNHHVHLNIAFMGNFLSTKVAGFGITICSASKILTAVGIKRVVPWPWEKTLEKMFKEVQLETRSSCGLFRPCRTTQLHAVAYAKDKIR